LIEDELEWGTLFFRYALRYWFDIWYVGV